MYIKRKDLINFKLTKNNKNEMIMSTQDRDKMLVLKSIFLEFNFKNILKFFILLNLKRNDALLFSQRPIVGLLQ